MQPPALYFAGVLEKVRMVVCLAAEIHSTSESCSVQVLSHGRNHCSLKKANLKLGSDILIAGPIHLLRLCDPLDASA